jgi:hypothetical protein
MKTINSLIVVFFGLALSAQAARYDRGFADEGFIPNGTGTCFEARPLNGLSPEVEPAGVTVNLSGGGIRDLCARLSYDGSRLVLLNGVSVRTVSGPTLALAYSVAASPSARVPAGRQAGAFGADGRGVTPAGTHSADKGDVSPEDLRVPDATDLSVASQPTGSSQFGRLKPLHVVLLGTVLCVASAGIGLQLYARRRAEVLP